MTDDALHRVETACAELTERGQPVTFPAVADHANLARATLYRRPELRAIIEDARARARNANTLTGLATEIQQLRTSLQAVSDKVRRHEESLRRLTNQRQS
ncbi:hypothetical protein BH24ACT15_BH24ACT15_26840 [soil metagenome]